MNRTNLRNRIVANVRKINAQVKAPQGEVKSQSPRTVTLFAG